MDSNVHDWATMPDKSLSLEEMDSLIGEYVSKRKEYEEAKKLSADRWSDLTVVESKIIQALTLAGKKSYKVDGVGTFTRVDKTVVTVPKELDKKRDLFGWIEGEYGKDVLDDMISINHQKLNSFYNQEAERHKDDPLFSIPGIDAPTHVEIASFRKDSK